MHWYLIHTKPRQERCALVNLEQQGYECYLPTMPTEKIRQGALTVSDEPLFPRYLFIRLGTGESAKAWGPVRHTKGVNRLVCFGNEPARVDAQLVEYLKAREQAGNQKPQTLFSPGERVLITNGTFKGIEAIYQMAEGERRVLVLIELLSKKVALRLAPGELRKIS